MKNPYKLSKKSNDFLENLRVYLFSSGKNAKEINEIIEELEVHLIEAEKRGKSIEHIIGHSPKEYMDQISNEMAIDIKQWIKFIPIIIFGAFSITIVSDLLEGTLSYSLLEIFGFLSIAVLFLAGTSIAFRYISSKSLSPSKQFFILFMLSAFPMGLFMGLIFLNQAYATPVIEFGMFGTIMIGVLTFFFIIGISLWSKTWILPIVIAWLELPELLLRTTNMAEPTRLLVSTFLTFGGIAIYLAIANRKERTA